MDFNMKKIVKDAGAALSRVVQRTEEKLGTSEKTELDARFENLWDRADTTKTWTEKLLRNTEAVLIPNPGNRIEDFVYEKIEKKKPSRLSNLEYLGLDMIEAGNVFGPGTGYGSALIKVGLCEQKLGQTERDFIGSAAICYTQPLRKFLEGEMKTILKEKSILELKRLDLDSCKNRVRKARSLLGQPAKDGITPEAALDQAERDLRVAQSEFDRQAEITKLLLEGVSSSHAAHLRCLNEFVETQARYFAQCSSIMTELQQELSSAIRPGPVLRINSEDMEPSVPNNTRAPSPSSYTAATIMATDDANFSVLLSSTTSSAPISCSISSPRNDNNPGSRRARVLYDYNAKDASELNLMANEVLSVTDIDNNEDYFYGERGQQRGKVPRAYLEMIP